MYLISTAWGYYRHAFHLALVWSGRATRAEYWFFVVVHAAMTGVMVLLDSTFGTELKAPPWGTVGLFATGYAAIILVVHSSLTVRRLHDIDRSAWFLLWLLIPIVGNLVLFVYNALPSIGHANRYGYNPHDRVTLGGSL